MKSAFKMATPAAALFLFAGGIALASSGVPEFSHYAHPLALRGTAGLPQAALFNVIVFVLPGLLLAWAGQGLRSTLGVAGWSARVGIVLVQLSALAFAAQGVFPLDPGDADASTSRLHALAWMLWWIAFVPGMLLLALGARRGRLFALACVVAGLLVPWLAVFAPIGAWVGVAQRLAFGLWFGWWNVAGWLSRVSASSPGSSPTART